MTVKSKVSRLFTAGNLACLSFCPGTGARPPLSLTLQEMELTAQARAAVLSALSAREPFEDVVEARPVVIRLVGTQ
ncbi:hypothetical protein ACMYR2_2630 [Nitrobacter sp. TKz-YC01]